MKIGYALCGSYCTHAKSLAVLEELVKVHTVVPIVSENAASTDTRFGKAEDLLTILEALCCGTESIVYQGTACEEIVRQYGGTAVPRGVKNLLQAIQNRT